MVTFELAGGVAPAPPDLPPFHEWVSPDGSLWTSFFRTASGYLLRFPRIADFVVDSEGRHVTGWPVPGVEADAVDLVYSNQVLPLALSKQGHLVLHASAVEFEGRALAFIGRSGHGKSTLAASFVLAGGRLLCDDALTLKAATRGVLVQPGHPSLRLWSDSESALVGNKLERAPAVRYTTKGRFAAIDPTLYCDEPRELACAFFLGEGISPMPSIAPMRATEALVELVKHSFLLDTEEPSLLSTHFDALSHLAALPLYQRLDYPRDYVRLPQVRQTMIDALSRLRAADAL